MVKHAPGHHAHIMQKRSSSQVIQARQIDRFCGSQQMSPCSSVGRQESAMAGAPLMAGKSVLVTGGTGGIGKATAIGLAALGPASRRGG